MRCYFVCLALTCFLTLCSGAATEVGTSLAGITNLLSMADLYVHFDDVNVMDDGLSFRFKWRGVRYKYAIGDEHSKIGAYGELVRLPLSQKMRVTNRDCQLVFQNVETNGMSGFLITRILDLRSIGRGRRLQNGFLVVRDQKGKYDKGCFMGVNQINSQSTRDDSH